MKLNECGVDKNERPDYLHKITGAKILVNPFNDIQPRKLNEVKKKDRKREGEKKESTMPPPKKNTSLLSFGDEMDEDEQQIAKINPKLKGKSAHDVLEDEFLSKESAVKPEELGNIEEREVYFIVSIIH
jgi:peptidyl-prolyl cis-trans isomerase SDCCAG10